MCIKIFDRSGQRGFTLIELLVVISIIALLLSILMPALSRVKQQARFVVCAAQLKQIGLSLATYANDYNDRLVPGDHYDGRVAAKRDQETVLSGAVNLGHLFESYLPLPNGKTFIAWCPAVKTDRFMKQFCDPAYFMERWKNKDNLNRSGVDSEGRVLDTLFVPLEFRKSLDGIDIKTSKGARFSNLKQQSLVMDSPLISRQAGGDKSGYHLSGKDCLYNVVFVDGSVQKLRDENDKVFEEFCSSPLPISDKSRVLSRRMQPKSWADEQIFDIVDQAFGRSRFVPKGCKVNHHYVGNPWNEKE